MNGVFRGWPAWAAFVVLFLGAVARGAATYAVGLGLRTAGSRSRWGAHLDRPAMKRAEGWLARWGAPVVTLGFLTVGVQSAINATAGVLRMPLRRFVPALLVGAALWALLYLTVGLAVLSAVFGRVSWWWAVVGIALITAIVVVSKRLGRTPAE